MDRFRGINHGTGSPFTVAVVQSARGGDGRRPRRGVQGEAPFAEEELGRPATFPSREVIKAYQHPSVDASEETFEWGKPDLDMLRLFCIKKFAWTRAESDQILVPMMKSWSKRDAQRRIDSFFQASHAVGGRVAKFRSKRLGDAVARLTNDATEAAKMVLKRPRETAFRDVLTEGDADERAPRLEDDDDEAEAMAELDLSQYSSDAKSPVKTKPEPKPKRRAPTRKRSAGKAPAERKINSTTTTTTTTPVALAVQDERAHERERKQRIANARVVLKRM